MLHRTGSRKLHTAKQLTPPHSAQGEQISTMDNTTADNIGGADVRLLHLSFSSCLKD